MYHSGVKRLNKLNLQAKHVYLVFYDCIHILTEKTPRRSRRPAVWLYRRGHRWQRGPTRARPAQNPPWTWISSFSSSLNPYTGSVLWIRCSNLARRWHYSPIVYRYCVVLREDGEAAADNRQSNCETNEEELLPVVVFKIKQYYFKSNL